MLEKLLVYTNCIGWDYALPPVTPTDDVDYICVTDREISHSINGWQTTQLEPLLPDDKFRSSRQPKTLPHLFFSNYERSVYIDSTVKLKTNPNRLWQHLMSGEQVVFGGIHHSFRETVQDEFIAVNSAQYDKTAVLQEQINAYSSHYPDILLQQPVWGGVLARRHNHIDCIKSMHIWFANILRYSRRDQLSLPVALSRLRPEQVNIVDFDLRDSVFHSWPFGETKKPPYQTVSN